MYDFNYFKLVKVHFITLEMVYLGECAVLSRSVMSDSLRPLKTVARQAPLPCLGWEGPLEEGMATHSSILAWRIPMEEEPGRLVHRVTKCQTRLSN